QEARDAHAGPPPQPAERVAQGDRPRPDHRDAQGIAHRFPGSRYITPARSEPVDSWVASTPRASTVKRHVGLVAISNPSVPFNPADTPSSASSTNVPLMAAPLPFIRCTLSPTPR